MKRTFKSINPGDMVIKRDRLWRVDAVRLGAVGQEDIVEIKALDRTPGYDTSGPVEAMSVPLDLIDHDCIYRPVDHAAAAKPDLRSVSEVHFSGNRETLLGTIPAGETLDLERPVRLRPI